MAYRINFSPPLDAHRYCQHICKQFMSAEEIEEAGSDCYAPLCPCLENHMKAKQAAPVGSAPPSNEGGSRIPNSFGDPIK